jgi:hypothetical protein
MVNVVVGDCKVGQQPPFRKDTSGDGSYGSTPVSLTGDDSCDDPIKQDNDETAL